MLEISHDDYLEILDTVSNHLDSMMYELETITSLPARTRSAEYRHDVYPIIRRLHDAKRLISESQYTFSLKKAKK
ncbi:hypothetical protein OAJ27_00665 [bacterium]|nr:hypothetical protein [bacterium]